MLGSLSLTLLTFGLISDYMDRKYVVPVFEAMDQLQLENARAALASGGRPAVTVYMAGLDRKFGPGHYLVDARGTDIVSGRNLASFLPPPPDDRSRGFILGRFVVTQKAADGRYWLVSAGPQKERQRLFMPYALVAIGMTALLSLTAALGIVLPIRRLTKVVQQFGRGELASRARLRRSDEIGALARSFNEMAGRIERLVTSERRLLQDISHELRSPLARLKFAIKLARTAPDRDAALDRVERDVDRITVLTADLVEMVRVEGETRSLHLETVNLGKLIEEVVEDCNTEPQHGVRCDVRLDHEIACDRELLRRAIENVFRNAIRHSPDQAPIEIAAEQRAGNTTVSIRDSGSGVPEENLDRIFAPFYRVDEARSAANGGIGLGLAIARSAIHRHGGAITAHNANPGLRVDIILPV
jgi:signal transduction histidine kinase